MTTINTTLARSPFIEAWEKVESIDGYLSRRQAQVLFRAANSLPSDAIIVEIGSFKGKSTALLAETGRSVLAIDPLIAGSGEADQMKIMETDADELRTVLDRYQNVHWVREKAADIDPADYVQSVEMLYIDGDHQGDAPLNDFRKFQPHLKRGALVLFHDYGAEPGVNSAVATLEREGAIKLRDLCGSLYFGQVTNSAAKRVHVCLGQPYHSSIDRKSMQSAMHPVAPNSDISARIIPGRSSLLAHAFNDCLVACHEMGGFDYFGMLHADVSCSDDWLGVMVRLLEKHRLDVLHTVIPIKDSNGLTSTAVAYSDDPWACVRRITTTELAKLPETFDIDALRECYDKNAIRLLPNTGCIIMRNDDWLRDFPGFNIMDRISRHGDHWSSDVVPEDWNFGHWCARNGIKVGGTKAVLAVHHQAQGSFSNNEVWGQEVDKGWVDAYTNRGRHE